MTMDSATRWKKIAILVARDGCVCWLCKNPIDLELVVPHKYAVTLDHYVPKREGGTNVTKNLKLAHNKCNGKRDKLFPESLEIDTKLIEEERHRKLKAKEERGKSPKLKRTDVWGEKMMVSIGILHREQTKPIKRDI